MLEEEKESGSRVYSDEEIQLRIAAQKVMEERVPSHGKRGSTTGLFTF